MFKHLTILVGQPVFGLDETIGRLHDVLFDDHCGQVLYLEVADARLGRRLVPAACLAPASGADDGVQVELTRAQADEFSRTLHHTPATGRAQSTVQLVGRRTPRGGTIVDVLLDVTHWSVDYVITNDGPLVLSASLAASLAQAKAH